MIVMTWLALLARHGATRCNKGLSHTSAVHPSDAERDKDRWEREGGGWDGGKKERTLRGRGREREGERRWGF